MTARPAGIPKVYLACILMLLTLSCDALALNVDSPTRALQQLAVQIKLAADQADAGHYPAAASLAALQHELDDQRNAATGVDDEALQHKFAAVSLLFGKLKNQSAQASSAQARVSTTRAPVDAETVSNRHGAGCTTALGISESLPVRVTLAQSGSGQSDAWFRFEPAAPGHFRFTTDSSGADPAIEVFQSCAAGAISLAANDDYLGLDAAVSVAAADQTGLLVHVTNSGSAGSVTLGVQAVNGTISGNVTDATTGLALSNAQILVFDSSAYVPQFSTNADLNGNYALSVAAGSYYVSVAASGYLTEIYPNATCPYGNYYYYNISGCALAQAQVVSVAAGATVSGVNVALGTGQHISGIVRDASNQPVVSAQVYLFDAGGAQLAGLSADSFGRYSFSTIPAGTYKAYAQASSYGSQMFDHVTCGGPLLTQCDLGQAGTITIANQDASGINFNLPLLATIQGNISGPAFQSDYYNNGQVYVLDAGGNVVTQAYLDASGHYSAGPLAIGTYYVYASVSGFFLQIFDGIDCAQDCYASMPAATPVAITQNGQVGAADFQLTVLPTVSGHIQDATSGAPLPNVTVLASVTPPATFAPVSSAITDNNGDYTLEGTPAGNYYLWAQSTDHIDQIYSGIACEANNLYYNSAYPGCDVTGATALTILPGQPVPAFDFTLQASSSISGHATINAGLGSDLPAAVQVNVYDVAGINVANVNTDSLGNYLVSDLSAGTYFVAAGSYYYSGGYITQVWQMVDCPDTCAPTMGTPVVVGQSETVPDIDFVLIRRDAVVGQVTDGLGAPVSGVLIDLFDSTTSAYLSTGVTDTQGFYATAANVGSSIFVATEVNGAFVDQVYSGIFCPMGSAYFGLCSLNGATAVILGNYGTQPHIVNFVLQPLPDKIFADGFE